MLILGIATTSSLHRLLFKKTKKEKNKEKE